MRFDHWAVSKLVALRADEEGASAIEYALIAGLLAAVLVTIVGGTGGLGEAITNQFNSIITELNK